MNPINKKLLGISFGLACVWPSFSATPIVIDGQEYAVDTLELHQVGPGTQWMRLRLPGYPLNVNLLTVDLNDPNVRIETTQANEQLFGTERLVDAAKRQTAPGHTAIAGANGNFWCVSQSYPYSEMLLGTTFNANLRNGKILTETNCHADQWDTGPARIGEIGITPDGRAFSDHFKWQGVIKLGDGSEAVIHGANKVVRDDELVMINSYFGPVTPFKPADMVWREGSGRWGFDKRPGVSTEVYLKLADGSNWSAGRDIEFEVVSKRTDAGDGTLGQADLALVARGNSKAFLDKLEPGQKIKLNYAWTTMDGQPIEFDNMIGGNGQVMIDGELTSVCQESENCALVYSKTGYGASADHKKFYIIVIDKSTDSRYGGSSGCTSAVMCQIARHYGCANMTNLDSGGSAQMFVLDKIQNTTTESSPRAVANGMMVYSVAPVDEAIARIEFYDRAISLPTMATTTPVVWGYNKYGHLVTTDLQGVTFSVDSSVGSTASDGTIVVAGTVGAKSILTANYQGLTASVPFEVIEAPFAFLSENIVTDSNEEPIFFKSTVAGTDYVYEPVNVEWGIETLEGEGQVVAIDGSMMKGLSNGKVKVTADMGGRQASAIIRVQLPEAEYMSLMNTAINPDDWKISRTSVKTATITPIGSQGGFRLNYNVSSARGPKVTVARDMELWGCPKAFSLDLDPGESGLVSVAVTVLPANSNRTVTMTLEPDSDHAGFLTVPLYEGERDLTFFPVTLKNIQFVPASKTGEYSVDVRTLGTRYDMTNAVENIECDVVGDSEAETEWFDMRGVKVNPANLAPGIYVRKQGEKTSKIVVNP